jgi:ABC-type antimicrobial peptide transport system permease subunit
MALGSTTREVFGLVLGDGARMVGLGLAIGLAGAFGLGRVMGQLLYGVRPMDPVVIGAVAVLLTVIALLAVIIPARRAARVNPALALQ